MSGKRLLDAAKLFGAARSVARSHAAIRSQQWEVYTQTSSLAKAVKNQTDRVTVTARAAYALSQRLADDIPAPNLTPTPRSHQTSRPADNSQSDPIPSKDGAQASADLSQHEQSLQQDHHYRRSEGNAAVDPPPEGELEIAQKKAERYPLPDGTIPPKETQVASSPSSKGEDTFAERPEPETAQDPLGEGRPAEHNIKPTESDASTIPDPAAVARMSQRLSEDPIPSVSSSAGAVPSEESQRTTSMENNAEDTFTTRPTEVSESLSSLPRVKIPKASEDSQGGDSHVADGQINQDVYYSSEGKEPQQTNPAHEAVPKQDAPPEGINTDVFHSPRVANFMKTGGKDDRRKAYEMKMKAAASTQNDQSRLATSPGQDTFNTRTGEATVENPISSEPQQATQSGHEDTAKLAEDLVQDATSQADPIVNETLDQSPSTQMRESSVPSSRFGRLWQYAGLGTSMAFGAVGESIRRVTGGGAVGGSLVLSEANMNRLVAKLSRMRGAALKLGQMMSFQDSKLLPPAINAVLQRVQDSADYMPPSQRDRVLTASIGSHWRDLFSSFDDVPIAAASIGQVHRATLAKDNTPVAVKVQYPGVRNSIDSDLNNLSLLLTASRLLPKGLYLDKTIANARTELAWECDYEREAACGARFHTLLADETSIFTVPRVITEASGPEVLTAEFMSGTGVTKVRDLSQSERDWIGTQILRLCLRELMEWRFMQTDPNWTNFLYERKGTHDGKPKLQLLDFGASREYPETFVTPYIQLLIAASRREKEKCRELSIQLGYLTGMESKAMLDAHVQSIFTLAEPFFEDDADNKNRDQEGNYDFKDQTITDRVRANIGLMLRERMSPPPEETYSLHRKLSGAFLLCARLGSKVPARQMFVDAVDKWEKGRNR